MAPELDLICVGTALVDSIIRGFDPTPVSASGYRAESGSLNVGGEAVNEAVAAAKLGLRTGIFCSLGADAAGDMVEAALRQNGVSLASVLRDAAHPTPVTTMFVNADGTRKSVTNGAHRYNFRPERAPERFTGARALILGSLFRAPFDEKEIVLSVLRAAKAAGQLVFADTKLPNFRALALADLAEALPLVDYITPNEDEARFFTGRDEPEAMAGVFLDCGVKNVVIKLGAKGCYFQNAERSLSLPPCRIRAVDATGAGDTFVAALAAELLRGAEIGEALRFANACGAICTTAVGALTALKNREQVLRFLEEQG